MRLWVTAKICETDKLRAGGVFRHFDQRIPLPKLGEWRQRYLLASPTLPGNVVKSLQPFQLAFAFGESLVTALFPAFTQLGKNIIIISRFVLRRHTLLIGNCGSLQGGMTLLPDADPSDGELDLLVLSADSIPGRADTMRNLVWDNGLRRLLSPSSSDEDQAKSSDSATHRRITELTVELDEPRVFEVDGDALGETNRVEISVQPGAVRVR